MRKYTYERLDGSIRAEERFAAIRSFSHKPSASTDAYPSSPFIFLISTRAGGVGLNLVAADTVSIFLIVKKKILSPPHIPLNCSCYVTDDFE